MRERCDMRAHVLVTAPLKKRVMAYAEAKPVIHKITFRSNG